MLKYIKTKIILLFLIIFLLYSVISFQAEIMLISYNILTLFGDFLSTKFGKNLVMSKRTRSCMLTNRSCSVVSRIKWQYVVLYYDDYNECRWLSWLFLVVVHSRLKKNRLWLKSTSDLKKTFSIMFSTDSVNFTFFTLIFEFVFLHKRCGKIRKKALLFIKHLFKN